MPSRYLFFFFGIIYQDTFLHTPHCSCISFIVVTLRPRENSPPTLVCFYFQTHCWFSDTSETTVVEPASRSALLCNLLTHGLGFFFTVIQLMPFFDFDSHKNSVVPSLVWSSFLYLHNPEWQKSDKIITFHWVGSQEVFLSSNTSCAGFFFYRLPFHFSFTPDYVTDWCHCSTDLDTSLKVFHSFEKFSNAIYIQQIL